MPHIKMIQLSLKVWNAPVRAPIAFFGCAYVSFSIAVPNRLCAPFIDLKPMLSNTMKYCNRIICKLANLVTMPQLG